MKPGAKLDMDVSLLNWQAVEGPKHYTHRSRRDHSISKSCFGLTFIFYGIHVTAWWPWWTFLQETKRKNFLPMTPNNAKRCLAFFSSQCICESDNVIIPVHRDYNLKIYSLPNYRQPVRRYQGVCSFVWITSVISSKYIYWKWEKKYSSLPACHHSWTENGHTTQISF